MDKRISSWVITALLLLAAPASAGWPGDAAKCKKDMVKVGSVCIDKYEASVWEVPPTNPLGKSNKGLISKIQNGTAKYADLVNGGATQRGVTSADYPCNDGGQNCKDKIYAVSLSDLSYGVKPSTYITWFQAQQACANSRKRLPTNAEWQMAAVGTPDPGPDNGTSDCNTYSAHGIVPAGSRSSCLSKRGAYDMVGNLAEWVADWVPASTTCLLVGWNFGGIDDSMCLAGASTTDGPGVLVRGGGFEDRSAAGPLSLSGIDPPSNWYDSLGFRCAR